MTDRDPMAHKPSRWDRLADIVYPEKSDRIGFFIVILLVNLLTIWTISRYLANAACGG